MRVCYTPRGFGGEGVAGAEGSAIMSTPSRLIVGACVVALGLACRTPRPAERSQPSPLPDVAARAPAPDVAAPADAAVEDVPPNVAAQRATLRACPAPAGTPTILPEPDSYGDVPGPWTPTARRTAADVPAPVATACAAMEARRRAALSRLGANAPSTEDDPHVEAVGRCFHAGRGAWVLEPGAARVRSGPDPAGETMRWVEVATTLAFVQADGRVLRMRAPAAATRHVSQRAWWSVFHDFDGDGTAEAGLRLPQNSAVMDGTSTTLYTVRDGAIVAYARGAGVDASAPLDVDGDGRPDFLTDSPFHTANTCGPSVFYGVPEAVHALGDGGFSRDDGVAREWMRQRCAGTTAAAADQLLDGGSPHGELIGRVGCLRYIGLTAEALLRAVDAQWPPDAEDHCWSRDGVLSSLRAARVPFQVAPCAADPGGS